MKVVVVGEALGHTDVESLPVGEDAFHVEVDSSLIISFGLELSTNSLHIMALL